MDNSSNDKVYDESMRINHTKAMKMLEELMINSEKQDDTSVSGQITMQCIYHTTKNVQFL